MFDLASRQDQALASFSGANDLGSSSTGSVRAGRGPTSFRYLASKRAFDLIGSLLLLPALVLAALVLLLLNPFLNRGVLLFSQERMGQDSRPFRAWKFRSMSAAPDIQRGAFDALDSHRITRLGGILRKTRVDELPQVWNVVRGEMSLIGPRPDYYPHALVYAEQVPGYRARHVVKPGISGYAQTEVGYVDGPDGVRAKVAADLHYVRHASFRFDLWIAWRTIRVVFGGQGA